MIVEQEQSTINELVSCLDGHNYSIFTAKNYKEGLKKSLKLTPDIIFLDITMAGDNNTNAYHLFKKQRSTRDIPIMLISDASTALKSLKNQQPHHFPTSANHYVSQPFNTSKICQQVEQQLRVRTLQAQLTDDWPQAPEAKPAIVKPDTHHVEGATRFDNEFYRLVVQNLPDAVLVECQGEIIFANQAAVELYQAESASALLGQSLINLTAAQSRVNATLAFRQLDKLNSANTQEEKALLQTNKTRDVSVTRLNFKLADQNAIQMVVRDISKRKHLESQLHFQATHDPVTGLPNRNLFTDRLHQAIRFAKRHQHELLVCFIDLYRFKRINDNMGHGVGDQLLIRIADRMATCIRASDTIARLEGDEFASLLPCAGDRQSALKIIHRIQDEVSKPIALENHSVTITCNIGYSLFPCDGANVSELLKQANTAMYHAKELGCNTIQPYHPSLQKYVDEYQKLEEALSNAIKNNELSLQYQVQVELRKGHVKGVEALLRWQNPDLGFVPPARFIPIAEQSGLIENITEWIIKTTCQQSKDWQQQGCVAIPIAVNISAISLRNPERLETLVTRCLDETQLDPTLLELELTESASMDDPEAVIPLMLRLKALGVRLAIDDFGTGYSNLHYLNQFPVDKLKLDGSFVRGITTEPRSLAITKAIITMAHGLDLTVIAEMVETKEQLQVLFEHGCDEIQGYYFSKPLPPGECVNLLRGKTMALPYTPKH